MIVALHEIRLTDGTVVRTLCHVLAPMSGNRWARVRVRWPSGREGNAREGLLR